MAERRMFAKSIVLSDAFLDMPMSARCLYFTLGMLADDDGFVGSPKAIMRQCGASNDDMNILLSKRYVLGFESGVIVIKHWRLNNLLKNDRKKDTTYIEEKNTLMIDEKGAYTEAERHLDPEWIQNGSKVEPQYRIGKDSIGKNNIYIPEVDPEEDPEKESKSELYKRIINYLNEKTGKHFRVGNEVTRLIDARLNAKASEQDFYTVIDNMCSKWLDDEKMNEYLRPITLFGSKFDSYLNTTPRRTYDALPVYDTSQNTPISEEEKRELLRLMGREDDEPTTYDKNSG